MKCYTNFRKSDDPNIVLADQEFTEEIHLDKLVAIILKQMSAIKTAKEISVSEPDGHQLIGDMLAERVVEMEAEFVEHKAILSGCEGQNEGLHKL